MTTNIKLVVGLGNPGPEYQRTRHNAGMWFVEQLAQAHQISLRPEKKYFGIYGKGTIKGQDVHLLMPTTFMNKSGQAVSALASFFRIPNQQILVAHDELDLAVGQCKIKLGGSHGGHNGLRDIIKCQANDNMFYRLRIGIDHPGHKDRVTGHVLGKAPANEQEKIDAAVDEAVRCFDIWQQHDLLKAQQRLHAFKA